jgi:hypothetical protein
MPQPLSKMTDPYDNTSNTDNPGSTQRGGRHATFSWGAPTGNSQGGGGSQYVTLTQEQAASGNVPWREQGASWEINRGGHSLNTDQDDDPFSQRQSSWDQVDEPFTQPQTHLTRDQFQSLSGLGNETSQVSLVTSIAEGRARFLDSCE